MMTRGWLAVRMESGDCHVVPVEDVVDHEPDDCICGPLTDLAQNADGVVYGVTIHHSLDGREELE